MKILLPLIAILLMVNANAQAPRPNIVHIFADDLGKGSIGVHGQLAREQAGDPHIKTPHLDTLATQGMIFHRAYAATLCSPSRGMLYFGFSQAHNANDRNTVSPRAQEVSLAEVLAPAGYTSGVFGKWGYGGSFGTNAPSGNKTENLAINPAVTNVNALPNTHGYDEFLGYINHSRAHLYFTSSLWTTDVTGNPVTGGLSEQLIGNIGPGNTNLQAANTHDVINDRCIQFIDDHYQDADPFYLQVNYTIPHNDLEWIQHVSGWFDDYAAVDTSAWTDKEKFYAAMITYMDNSIGELIAKLEDPAGDGTGPGNDSDNQLSDTLIIFTSDNGATNADFNTAGLNHFGILDDFRGGKRDLWEGGINVPQFARWDGVITPGSSTQVVTDLTDFMATIADLAGVDAPVGIDGISLAPTITGEGTQRTRDYITFEHHEGNGPDSDGRNARWCIIQGQYKLIHFSNNDDDLYDLTADPDENSPLDLGIQANADKVTELTALAIADGVEQGSSYDHDYAAWTGADGDSLTDSSKWDLATAPVPVWSATVANTSGSASTVDAAGLDVLGLEVLGTSGMQTVRVDSSLTGRNAVRVGNNARIYLENGTTLTSWRWTDVRAGGYLTGSGTVEKDFYNSGTLAPGLPADISAPPASPVTPGLATAVDFDVQGQDPPPVTTTDTLSPNVTISAGFQMGPGITPRGTANDGNEFNVKDFPRNNTALADAISGDDYLTYTLSPNPGVEMLVTDLSFTLRRNGTGSPQEYAILTSLDGFNDTAAIVTANYDASDATQKVLTGTYTGDQWTSLPVEVRIYAWDQEGNNGHTHFYDASMTADFRSAAASTIDATGHLAFTGNFTHQADATLALDLGGTDNSDPLNPEYDHCTVTGDAILDGELTVALDNSFTPTKGDTFTILAAASISGSFNNSHDVVMTSDNSAAFAIQTGATEVTLEALEGGLAPGGTPNWWLDANNLPLNIDHTDTDGDGLTEAEEFLGNTNPNQSETYALAVYVMNTIFTDGQAAGVVTSTEQGIQISIEGQTNLPGASSYTYAIVGTGLGIRSDAGEPQANNANQTGRIYGNTATDGSGEYIIFSFDQNVTLQSMNVTSRNSPGNEGFSIATSTTGPALFSFLDDGNDGNQIPINLELTANTDYYFRVEGAGGGGIDITDITVFTGEPPAPSDKPNILWLVAEDLSPMLGCYGDSYAVTPNLDNLASQGMRYDCAWSNASVCSAARSTLITGMYGNSIGVSFHRQTTRATPPSFLKYYPQLMQEAGYYTTNNSKTDYNMTTPGGDNGWDASSGSAHWRNRPAGTPFFAVFNYGQTHESGVNNQVSASDRIHDPALASLPECYPDIQSARQQMANHHDRITLMDTAIQNRIQELIDDGLYEDTIIFFYGDHGSGMAGYKRHHGNRGMQVPLLVRIPDKFSDLAPSGYTAGGSTTELVSFVDLPPTILSLAGGVIPNWHHGRAFAGPDRETSPGYLHGHVDRFDERTWVARSVRDERYVYVRNYRPDLPDGMRNNYASNQTFLNDWISLYHQGQLTPEAAHHMLPQGPEELYDLQTDPDEVRNLANDPAHQAKLIELRNAHIAQRNLHHDVALLKEGILLELVSSTGLSEYDIGQNATHFPAADLYDTLDRGSLGTAADIPVLVSRLSHAHPSVRHWALIGLMQHGRDAVQNNEAAIIARLGDTSDWVQITAAQVLATHGTGANQTTGLNTLFTFGQGPTGTDEDRRKTLFAQEAISQLPFLPDSYRATLNSLSTGTFKDYMETVFYEQFNNPLQNFRHLHGIDRLGADDLENPSGDGISNLMKFATNLAPNAGDLLSSVASPVMIPGGTAGLPVLFTDPLDGKLKYQYLRRIDAADVSGANPTANVKFAPEASVDLNNWTVDASIEEVENINADWERVTLELQMGSAREFRRLNVER